MTGRVQSYEIKTVVVHEVAAGGTKMSLCKMCDYSRTQAQIWRRRVHSIYVDEGAMPQCSCLIAKYRFHRTKQRFGAICACCCQLPIQGRRCHRPGGCLHLTPACAAAAWAPAEPKAAATAAATPHEGRRTARPRPGPQPPAQLRAHARAVQRDVLATKPVGILDIETS